MNKLFVGMIISLLILFLVSVVSAHPSSDLNLTYNQTTGNLSATFTHQVADNTTHFIKQVQISLDGIETVNGNYESQPTVDFFTYIYPLNATPKTEIEVVGTCNLGGTIKRSVTA